MEKVVSSVRAGLEKRVLYTHAPLWKLSSQALSRESRQPWLEQEEEEGASGSGGRGRLAPRHLGRRLARRRVVNRLLHVLLRPYHNAARNE